MTPGQDTPSRGGGVNGRVLVVVGRHAAGRPRVVVARPGLGEPRLEPPRGRRRPGRRAPRGSM